MTISHPKLLISPPPLRGKIPTDLAVEIVRRSRPALLAMIGNPRTCIFSTRVACGVFGRLGIVNRPLAVELTVFNPAMTRLIQHDPPLTPQEFERQISDEKRVCFYIGSNVPPSAIYVPPTDGSRGWDYHLVCLVENRVILDLSIDQCNRPQYGIELEAAVAVPEAEPLRRFMELGEAIEGTDNGCLIRYRRVKDDQYLTAGDWDREHTRDAVLAISEAAEEGWRRGRWPSFHTRPRGDRS